MLPHHSKEASAECTLVPLQLSVLRSKLKSWVTWSATLWSSSAMSPLIARTVTVKPTYLDFLSLQRLDM